MPKAGNLLSVNERWNTQANVPLNGFAKDTSPCHGGPPHANLCVSCAKWCLLACLLGKRQPLDTPIGLLFIVIRSGSRETNCAFASRQASSYNHLVDY